MVLMLGSRVTWVLDNNVLIKYDSSFSSWGSIGVGVQRWSILGPQLFSLLVNDLPNVVDHTFLNNYYADDTELHCSGDNLQLVQDDLQSDINQIQN